MCMNTIPRRVMLALTTILAAYVGVWAAALAHGFYQAFPGFGLTWISADGPFDEHLIRDVGGLYLGLAAAGAAAIVSRGAAAGRVVGLGWAVFGVLHFGYHLLHPEGTAIDMIGNIVSLGVSLVLGILLALPSRRPGILVPVLPDSVEAATGTATRTAASETEAAR
jgi:hypothetical protein